MTSEKVNKTETFTATIVIPFETERQARIVSQSLNVDLKHEPSRLSSSMIAKEIRDDHNELQVKIVTTTLRHLRLQHRILAAVFMDSFYF
ncbi:phosphatidylinositol N-acetylglucosaminyltransferase subunit P-like [Euroglyphus maynei]|uniref:Phosphatidylinositol N-acetylglucosaminyltransferase subunit P-like n=1 Tax=Euroglyphus maynei TaxID=6958 RepID=A0A1Y3B5W1_EURMA|nr:phosphatidylinositol N-acetylglucosaminyltransferase subunit P-like [Euroglyphus maynei]